MKEISFTKMVASGNDFVIIDSRRSPATKTSAGKPVAGRRSDELARSICDRKFGIGADGLLLLEKSKKAQFKMRIFNPDGSEAAMCGNGARCAALFYTSDKRPATSDKKVRFETKAGIIEAEVKKDVVKLKMTDPKEFWPNIDLNIGAQFYKVHYIDTGVPHTVFFVGNVDTINVKDAGKQIRFHKQFHPAGTNANFAQVIDNKTLKIRTYERGVEDETLACGTGSTACALIAHALKLISKMPVNIETRSGEALKIYFDNKNNKFSNVWLEGGARVVFEGKYLV